MNCRGLNGACGLHHSNILTCSPQRTCPSMCPCSQSWVHFEWPSEAWQGHRARDAAPRLGLFDWSTPWLCSANTQLIIQTYHCFLHNQKRQDFPCSRLKLQINSLSCHLVSAYCVFDAWVTFHNLHNRLRSLLRKLVLQWREQKLWKIKKRCPNQSKDERASSPL